MPSIESMELNQTAVFWEISSRDEFGEPVFLDPQEIPIRWQDARLDRANPLLAGQDLDGWVATEFVLPVGSAVWLGTLLQWEENNEASRVVYEVVRMENIPDLKGQEYRRIALLKRFRTTPPALVS